MELLPGQRHSGKCGSDGRLCPYFKKGDIEDLKQKIQYLEDEQKEAAQYRGGAQQHD